MPEAADAPDEAPSPRGSAAEVFAVALKLGVTSSEDRSRTSAIFDAFVARHRRAAS